jgi:hypothetical protein
MPGGEGEAQGRSGGTDMADDYVAAVEYVLTCVAGYLRHRARDELVLIVIGDHQPPALVSGPEASWDVPVHVIARDPSLMAALRAEGFVAGLEPAPTGIAAMHDLAALLLRAFDGDAPPTAAGAAADPLTASRRGAPEPRVDVAGSVGR